MIIGTRCGKGECQSVHEEVGHCKKYTHETREANTSERASHLAPRRRLWRRSEKSRALRAPNTRARAYSLGFRQTAQYKIGQPSMAPPASWPSPATTKVIEVEGCGRGVAAAVDIRAGAPILCEVALASMNLSSLDMQQDPMLTSALLAAALLVDSTVHGLTRALEPQTADGLVLDQATDAVAEMRRRTPASATVDDRELLRLLHVVQRNALELLGHQALCVRASMINHSCTPNATHMGFRRRADGALCCCIRAVRDIRAGEEVRISYVEDLACGAAERAAALAHHGFGPDARAADGPLEAWAPTAPAPSDPRRAQLERELSARNSAADAAWSSASGARAHGESDTAAPKQLFMQAAAHYAQLLQLGSGVLGEGHAMLLQARLRLAKVMMMSGAQRSQANSLPLWQAALAVTRTCVPTHWPALLELLRGAAAAATAAGAEAAAQAYSAEVRNVLAVLQPQCADVAE